jgi:hypothetical protein
MGIVTLMDEPEPAAPPAPPFEVGDRVIAVTGIGAIRPRVPQGTLGLVVASTPAGELEIHFSNGRVELVAPAKLAAAKADPDPVRPSHDPTENPDHPTSSA